MTIRTMPWLLRRLLELAVPRDWRPDVVRDLEEAWSLRRTRAGRLPALAWLTGQVLLFALRFAPERLAELSPGRWSSTDLRLAWRATVRAPLVTLLATISLTVGVGAAMLGFTLTYGLAFAGYPFEGGDRIVLIQDYNRTARTSYSMGPEEFLRRRAVVESYDHFTAWTSRSVVVGGGDGELQPRVERVLFVTPDFLGMTGVQPLLGRLPLPEDGAPGAEPTVVLPHTHWVRLTGADPGILGRTLEIGGVPRTVIGVMPEGFGFPYAAELWVPFDITSWEGRVSVVARRRAGVGLDAARAEMAAVGRVDPSQAAAGDEVTHLVVDMSRPPMVDDRQIILVLVPLGILVLLLLLMAANVANLVLARNARRQDELAVRAALGGSRTRIVGQLALEVALLAGLSTGAGFLLARYGVAVIEANVRDLPIWSDFSVGPGAVLFALALALLVTVVAGVLPAARATGRSPAAALKDGSWGSGLRFGRLTGSLVVVQVALSVGFLSAAALLGQSLVTFGFDRYGLPGDETLVTQLYFGWPQGASSQEPDPVRRAAVADSFLAEASRKQAVILEEALALPGVAAAAYGDRFPGNESIRGMVEVEESAQPVSQTELARVGPGYFSLLGSGVVAGRDLTPAEYADAAPVALVNEPFVRERLGGANPLGRRVRVVGPEASEEGPGWVTVVGVVPDLGLNPGNPAGAAAVYLPLPRSSFVRLALRGGPNPSAWTAAVAQLAREVDPSLQIQGSRTLESLLREPVTIFRTLGTAFLVLGFLALVLSAASLHAITATNVTGRTRELGIRQALGAGRGAIVGEVVRRSARQVVLGGALGAGLAFVLLRIGSFFPWEVRQANPLAALLVVGLLVLATGSALAEPLRRALSIRPADAMRSE